MAVVDMSKLTLVGLQEDKIEITEKLMKMGLVDIDESYEFSDEIQDYLTNNNIHVDLSQIDRHIEKIGSAIDNLKIYDKRKKLLFSPKRTISEKQLNDIENKSDQLLQIADEILEFEKNYNQYTSEINRLHNSYNNLSPWQSLDIPWDIESTKRTRIFRGVMPSTIEFDVIETGLYEAVSASYIELLNNDNEQYYILLITHADCEVHVLDYMKKFNFTRVSFKELSGTTNEQLTRINNEIKGVESKQRCIKEKITEYAQYLDELEVLYDCFNIRKEREDALRKLKGSRMIFVLRGWIPTRAADKVRTVITSLYECIFEIENVCEDEEFPIMLDNKGMAESVEMITEMYSLPNSKEIDPNTVMAPFFTLFFGLMLSDAGYGLLLATATAFILKKFELEKSQKKFMKLMFYCGLATVFWGTLFGSWFGNLVYTISSGKLSINPMWFDPITDPEKLLTWSLAFGIIHLYVGIGVKAANLIRDKKYFSAIFDAFFWYILFTGAVFSVLPYVPGIDPNSVTGFVGVGKYLLLIGAVLLILTQGRSQKNPVLKLFSGLTSLYDLVSFMSDVLSYSRLLALGLATGVIATIINQMGAMAGLDNIFGILLFILVCVFGHTFNFLLNALSAYVHSSRLQYIEFFGKFYEGGGKAFNPLKINTKYITIKNDREDL